MLIKAYNINITLVFPENETKSFIFLSRKTKFTYPSTQYSVCILCMERKLCWVCVIWPVHRGSFFVCFCNSVKSVLFKFRPDTLHKITNVSHFPSSYSTEFHNLTAFSLKLSDALLCLLYWVKYIYFTEMNNFHIYVW